MERILCLVAACLGLSGCQMGPRNDSNDSLQGAENLPVIWEASGTYSHLTRSIRLVIRDEAGLSQLPLCQIPVDFDTQMVLIAGLGPTATSDLGIRIQRVWQRGSRILVEERQIHPGLDRRPGLKPASPWTAVVVPRSDLNVEGYISRVPPDLFGHVPGVP